MRYGVVITGGSAEAGEAWADDEDFPPDARGSGRVGQGLRHVRVKLTPGRIDTMLSTQVSYYRSYVPVCIIPIWTIDVGTVWSSSNGYNPTVLWPMLMGTVY